MEKYDILSDKAESFINNEAILDALEFAQAHKSDKGLIAEIMAKANEMQGISPVQAAVLLLNDDAEITEQIFALSSKITDAYYGNRKVLFAPLYLSNYCINGCVYCPFHASNKTLPRRRMTQAQVRAEVIALQDMGHKRLALEAGEDPVHNPLEYILESIDTIYGIHHKAGSIRRVNVNIAATTVENYKQLHDAKIGTYILFQETYNKKEYEALHPRGPKSNYAYHTEAMDRAMSAGIEDVGLGVLFGLHSYQYELIAVLFHAQHLEAKYGAGPHTISVPRLQPATGVKLEDIKKALPDEIFLKIVALLRIAVPYTGLIMSTREGENIRRKALSIGISQISGGSKTSVGGYTDNSLETEQAAQFELSDNRSLDEIVHWLMGLGYVPSFCTACYGKGRQGVDFMEICKKKQIHNFCTPNALLTLSEYLSNYASEKTQFLGDSLIKSELAQLPPHIQKIISERLADARLGHVKFL